MLHNRWLYFQRLLCDAVPQPVALFGGTGGCEAEGGAPHAARGENSSRIWRVAHSELAFQTARPSLPRMFTHWLIESSLWRVRGAGDEKTRPKHRPGFKISAL
jgi:hypothetical protein